MTNNSIGQATQPPSTANLPATSLIICSRNRPKLLLDSVVSILHGDALPTELIVVDQSDALHPTLSTMNTVRGCTIRYLWTHTVGLSRANNIGIAASCYDILVFTHDDVLVDPTWFGSIVQALLVAGPRGVVTGQVLPTAERPGGFQLTIKTDPYPAIYQGRIGEDVLFPLNMAMYRSAVTDVGFFDEQLGPGTPFPSAEDNDFGFRLLETGYRIVYAPEAALYHRAWRTEREYLRLRWSYAFGQGAFYAKHLSLRDRYMMLRMLKHLKNHMLGFIYRFRRERIRAYGHAVSVAGIVLGACKWVWTQRRTS